MQTADYQAFEKAGRPAGYGTDVNTAPSDTCSPSYPLKPGNDAGIAVGIAIEEVDASCTPSREQLTARTPCNDIAFAVLFVLQVIGVAVVAGLCLRDVDFSSGHGTYYDGSSNSNAWGSSSFGSSSFDGISAGPLTVRLVAHAVGCGAGFSVAVITLFLLLLRAFPAFFIWAANIILIAAYVGLAVYLGLHNSWQMLIPSALMILWLFLVRKRIPLAALLLGQACRLVVKFWGSFVIGVLSLVAKLGYFAMWGFAAMYFIHLNNINTIGNGALGGLIILWLFLGFWTMFVAQGVVRVTISGSVASWYFFGEANCPSSPSIPAARRAVTTSFGSICFGSLLCAFLAVLSALFRGGRGHRNGVVGCCCACILSFLEGLMQYFNDYAFTHIAIYGTPYAKSAKLTWEFMKTFVFSAIINDALYSKVIALIVLMDMIWIPIVTGVITKNWWAVLVAALVTGATHVVLLFAVPCAVTALFVCIAESRGVLAVHHPELNADLEKAIQKLNENPCDC